MRRTAAPECCNKAFLFECLYDHFDQQDSYCCHYVQQWYLKNDLSSQPYFDTPETDAYHSMELYDHSASF